MNSQMILKRITSLTFRQVFYLLMGIFLLITGIINKDWTIGALSLLFLYQGIFNTCLFGSCAIPKR
jgi:uncharacterized membrane protein YiaA